MQRAIRWVCDGPEPVELFVLNGITSMDAKLDYSRGFSEGYDGTYSGVIENRKNLAYLAGHSAGSKLRQAEYRSTCNATFETANMTKSADARVFRGGLQ
jgi:hypothetical protein